jgi:hypothetical protein
MKPTRPFPRLFLLALAVLTTLGVQAQRRTFDLRNFDRVNIGSALQIDIRQGGTFRVEAEGTQSDLDDLEASVSGGTLKVQFKEGRRWSNRQERVRLAITMPTVRGLDLSGATQSTVEGFDNLNEVDLNISGASSSRISLSAKKINLDLSGASSVTLTGKASQMNGDVSGATSFRASEFEVTNARLEVSGASTAKLYVTGGLVAEASGASSVRYRGKASVQANTSGASSVRSE